MVEMHDAPGANCHDMPSLPESPGIEILTVEAFGLIMAKWRSWWPEEDSYGNAG